MSANVQIMQLTFMLTALYADNVMQLVLLVMEGMHSNVILVRLIIWSMRQVLRNHQSIASQFVLMDFMIMGLGLVLVIFLIFNFSK